MATQKQDEQLTEAEAAAREAEGDSVAEADEGGKRRGGKERYDHDRLVAEAQALADVEPHVMAGALADESRQTLTRDQATDAVKKFLKREVSTGATAQEG